MNAQMAANESPVGGQTDQITQFVKLSRKSRALLTAEMPPTRFIDFLIGQGEFRDAVRSVPYLLPNRHAVWWACLCIWHSLGRNTSPQEHSALGAAVHWVVNPSIAHRKAVVAATETIDSTTPAGCLGKSILVADAYLPEEGKPSNPTPKPNLAAQLAGVAVNLAYFAAGREHDVRRRFAVHGLSVLRGENLWA